MSRPRKAIVDYFPHYVNHGKTMFTIESKYGNDGYAFWFKVLELLGSTEHHFLDCNDIETWEFLLAKTRVSEETAISILDTCSKLGAIDQELWNNKIVRSNNFIENLESVYKRREVSVQSNEDVLNFCKQKSFSMGVSSNKNLQSKIRESTIKDSKNKESKREERIIKENLNPNPVSENKNKEPGKEEIQIQEENSEAEEEEIQEPRKKIVGTLAGEITFHGWEDDVDQLLEPELDRKVFVISPEPKESHVAEIQDMDLKPDLVLKGSTLKNVWDDEF